MRVPLAALLLPLAVATACTAHPDRRAEPPDPAPSRTASRVHHPPESVGPVTMTVAARSGGRGTFTWRAEYPAFAGLAPAAATRAGAGVAHLIDADVAAARADAAREDAAVTFRVTASLRAYDPLYATVELVTAYFPRGAVHPRYSLDTYVVRRATGAPVTLADFAAPGRLPDLLRAIGDYATRRLPEVLGEPIEGSFREGLEPDATRFARITPLPEGLEVIWDVYDVAPFSAGFPRLTVPWTVLRDAVDLTQPIGVRDPAYRDGQPVPANTLRAVTAAVAGSDDVALRPAEYRLDRVQIAQAHPGGASWVMALVVPVGPAAASQDTGVVALHQESGAGGWTVVDVGTSGVGCRALPAAVRLSFALRCG